MENPEPLSNPFRCDRYHGLTTVQLSDDLGKKFRIDEANLVLRIENLRKIGPTFDVSQEQDALTAIHDWNKRHGFPTSVLKPTKGQPSGTDETT